ncbi:hypothetical protein D1872_300210 [compost metagenome]
MKKVRDKMMFHTLTAPGIITAQIVSSSPKFLTSRYVGTSPPPKNKVIRNRVMNHPRPFKRSSDNA